ncbi:MAG: hypothetical protein IPK16_19185 [Anaerolineales bacterium]|nr:hypothetical protein [Anaerolineales bacterium]
MYPLIVATHNLMRWVVVILAIYALVRVYMGWLGKKEFTETDRKALSFSSIGLDIQVLLGLVVYFMGGWFNVFGNMGSASGKVRFYGVEHITMMLIAVVLAHLGVVMSKKAATPAGKFKRAAIYVTLSVLAVLVGIPWQYSNLLPTF